MISIQHVGRILTRPFLDDIKKSSEKRTKSGTKLSDEIIAMWFAFVLFMSKALAPSVAISLQVQIRTISFVDRTLTVTLINRVTYLLLSQMGPAAILAPQVS